MSWLRLDDDYFSNPKIVQLERAEQAIWIDGKCWLCKYDAKLDGYIPDYIEQVKPEMTPSFIERLCDLRLLDVRKNGLRVHDWDEYRPPKDQTGATRQARWRARQKRNDDETKRNAARDGPRNASRNAQRNAPDLELKPRTRESQKPEPSPAPVAREPAAKAGAGAGGGIEALAEPLKQARALAARRRP